MSELESGSATVGGGGRGMPSYWPYTFLWGVLEFLSSWVGGSVVLSGATLRRKLSLNSKKLVLFLKFISVLTAPFYTSFPTLSPPPHPSRPLWSEVNVDIQYQVTAYLRTPEHEPESYTDEMVLTGCGGGVHRSERPEPDMNEKRTGLVI